MQEFIALAKNSPNKLTFGSVGVGTPQHFGGELFKMHAGVDLIHVPFRGATMVIPDLLAGRIDMFIGAINSLLPLIKEGKLRALAMAGGRRVASLPDVPTMSEAGLSGFEVGSGVGLVAPAGTPPDIVDTLNREIGKIIATPGYQGAHGRDRSRRGRHDARGLRGDDRGRLCEVGQGGCGWRASSRSSALARCAVVQGRRPFRP